MTISEQSAAEIAPDVPQQLRRILEVLEHLRADGVRRPAAKTLVRVDLREQIPLLEGRARDLAAGDLDGRRARVDTEDLRGRELAPDGRSQLPTPAADVEDALRISEERQLEVTAILL